MQATQKGVRAQHPDYVNYLPKWQRCADAVAGQDAIHAGQTKYLARLKDERDEEYKARLGRTDYFNATWRTIAGLTGMAFSKPPMVTVPKAIEPHLDDITMSGVSLDDLARDLVEDVLEYGRMGILVDHPPAPENVVGLTLAASESLGLRPMIQVYEAQHIINWRFARVRNSWMLVQVVLTEEVEIGGDEFSHDCETRYRVLDLDEAGFYRQRVFRISKKDEDEQVGGDVYPLMNGKPLGYIPFTFVGAGGKADEIDEPPLIDLVDANIAHFQITADYRHGLHFTGLPTPVVSGYTPTDPSEKFHIGSLTAWVFPDPAAKASYLEFTGTGLTALENALAIKEKHMSVLGARMITDEHNRRPETATATQIKRVGENSILAAIVIAVSQSIEWALGVYAEWAGAGGEISYQINREFTPVPMDAPTLTALVAAMQQGALSESELFDQLQRGDVIDAQKTFEAHQEEIKSNPPIPRPAVVPPVANAA